MSQKASGYQRVERDLYETPAWVTRALLPHIPTGLAIWEPAAGSGKMANALMDGGHKVWATDISDPCPTDFLLTVDRSWRAIVTNPPYELAQEFIDHAMRMVGGDGLVAMLLRTDFDHAKTRQHLFGKCPEFSKKLVLTRRIKWFEDSKGQPSFNHAWFIWDMARRGEPTIAYGP